MHYFLLSFRRYNHRWAWGGGHPIEDFAYVVNSDVRGGRYYIRPPLEPRPMPIYVHNTTLQIYYIAQNKEFPKINKRPWSFIRDYRVCTKCAFFNYRYSHLGHIHHDCGFQDRIPDRTLIRPKKYASDKAWKEGSIIGVYFDSWRGHVEFYLNRTPLGIAFTGQSTLAFLPSR